MKSATTPTIGRRLWFFASNLEGVMDQSQPFDAGVIFVHGGGLVNLDVTRHDGTKLVATSIEVHDPETQTPTQHNPMGQDAHSMGGAYAVWMPYQKAKESTSSSTGRPADVPLVKIAENGEPVHTPPTQQAAHEGAFEERRSEGVQP
jgi:hypothetical protein